MTLTLDNPNPNPHPKPYTQHSRMFQGNDKTPNPSPDPNPDPRPNPNPNPYPYPYPNPNPTWVAVYTRDLALSSFGSLARTLAAEGLRVLCNTLYLPLCTLLSAPLWCSATDTMACDSGVGCGSISHTAGALVSLSALLIYHVGASVAFPTVLNDIVGDGGRGKLNPLTALLGCTVKLGVVLALPLGAEEGHRTTYLLLLLGLYCCFAFLHRGALIGARWRICLLQGCIWTVFCSLLAPHLSHVTAVMLVCIGWFVALVLGGGYAVLVWQRFHQVTALSPTLTLTLALNNPNSNPNRR